LLMLCNNSPSCLRYCFALVSKLHSLLLCSNSSSCLHFRFALLSRLPLSLLFDSASPSTFTFGQAFHHDRFRYLHRQPLHRRCQ
jgi:hypothetical protein